KTLIQRTLREHGRPRTTSAKGGKNGFVISRSPVRCRRVAPCFQLLRRVQSAAYSLSIQADSDERAGITRLPLFQQPSGAHPYDSDSAHSPRLASACAG